jgi:spermidine synthase
VAHNREALRLEPTLPSARNNLAWLLATSPEASLRDPAEALRLAEGLRDETREPGANLLDTLAAAYAAAGRFDEAIRSAEQAATLAEAEGDLALAQTFRRRISDYQSRKPHTAAYPSPEPSSRPPLARAVTGVEAPMKVACPGFGGGR